MGRDGLALTNFTGVTLRAYASRVTFLVRHRSFT